MSGYVTIIGLLCLQAGAFVVSVDEYADKKMPDDLWLTEMEDKPPASQLESVNDAVLKNAVAYPKVARRGYAGEEFFLKASKSVPRIGRRNHDEKQSPKRSPNKEQINMAEFWPYFQPNEVLARKHDFDLQTGCHQLDAKTIFLVDMYNYVCNDQFYCCETPAKHNLNSAPTVNYV